MHRIRDRRARDDARVERERELERERGDLVAVRTRMARGEGGVRSYAARVMCGATRRRARGP